MIRIEGSRLGFRWLLGRLSRDLGGRKCLSLLRARSRSPGPVQGHIIWPRRRRSARTRYEPESPASEFPGPSSIHSLARRACLWPTRSPV